MNRILIEYLEILKELWKERNIDLITQNMTDEKYSLKKLLLNFLSLFSFVFSYYF